jgi:hypothetical protein
MRFILRDNKIESLEIEIRDTDEINEKVHLKLDGLL